MKRVIATPSGAELELLRNMLQHAGVPCVIRNEALSDLLGTTPFNAELWVEREADFPRARALCAAWEGPGPETGKLWICLECGQRLDVQFDSCWQCGTRRNAPAPAFAAASTLPGSWVEANLRAEKMSSLLDAILHQTS